MKEKNFVLTVGNIKSPVIITVPHGGMKNSYASWLNNFFQPRVKSIDPTKNYIGGEKIVTGDDCQILHVAMSIMRGYKANMVAGLLPRSFVDYNRFNKEVAYVDERLKKFYFAYHEAICQRIEILLRHHKNILLIDIHGFGKQPIPDKNFDLILGTNDHESTPHNYDELFYRHFSNDYKVFVSGEDGLPNESDLYRGDATNLFYFKKYGIDGILLEISPKYRTGDSSKDAGEKLSSDIASFLSLNF